MFRNDPSVWFYDQASEMTCMAQSILAGQGLSSPFCGNTGPSAFLAPGYPLLVALVYRAFGVASFASAAVLMVLHVGFSVLTVLMVMLVARRIFDSRTAYIAGMLCAMSPTMMLLPTLFWETSLSTLLLTSALALTLWCADDPKLSRWIAVGSYCGLAMYINPALLMTFVGVVAWAGHKTKAVSLRGPLLAAATCAVIFSVWPIRNAIALHAFVPLRSNLGYELWQGNRPESQGLFTADVYLNQNRDEFGRYAAIGELPYMREKSSIAVKAIKGDPKRFVRLSLKRVGIFWTALGGRQISRMVIGEISGASLFAIAGLMMMRRRRVFGAGLVAIPFLVFPLPYYMTHPDFRFRLLLEPLALMVMGWVTVRTFSHLVPRTTGSTPPV